MGRPSGAAAGQRLRRASCVGGFLCYWMALSERCLRRSELFRERTAAALHSAVPAGAGPALRSAPSTGRTPGGKRAAASTGRPRPGRCLYSSYTVRRCCLTGCAAQAALPSTRSCLLAAVQSTDGCVAAAAVSLVVAALHSKAAATEAVAPSGLLPFRQAQQEHLLQALTGA